MTYNKENGRKNMRLRGYDYSRAGLYFLTMVIQNRLQLFGHIQNGEMILNDAGRMVEKWYHEIENKYPDKRCHEMVVMPNHFHCIIENMDTTDAIDAMDTIGAMNVMDATNAMDTIYVMDTMNVMDAIDATDATDVMDVTDVTDAHVGAPLRGRPKNDVHSKNEMYPEINVHPENDVHSKNEMYPKINVHPEINVHPKNDMHPENDMHPKNEMRPENDGRPKNDVRPKNAMHSTNDVHPENNVHPHKYGLHNKKYGSTIGDVMDWFKTMTTNEYIRGVKNNHWKRFDGKLWQRNYYDHIIRNDKSFQTISNYIIDNPTNWQGDKFFD